MSCAEIRYEIIRASYEENHKWKNEVERTTGLKNPKRKFMVDAVNIIAEKMQEAKDLLCERVNDYSNNRCINCGAKEGHKCEKKE